LLLCGCLFFFCVGGVFKIFPLFSCSRGGGGGGGTLLSTGSKPSGFEVISTRCNKIN